MILGLGSVGNYLLDYLMSSGREDIEIIVAGRDRDKMEKLGIYEVVEEDVALCEYVCPSKIEIQEIVSKGIDLMMEEE